MRSTRCCGQELLLCIAAFPFVQDDARDQLERTSCADQARCFSNALVPGQDCRASL